MTAAPSRNMRSVSSHERLTSLKWKDWIDKILAWADWLNPLSWLDFIPKLDWNDFISWLGGNSSGSTAGDFVMRPGGGATSFSPDDTIIGVKDTSKLGGGGTTTINNYYNVQGYTEQQLTDKFRAIIERYNADASRSGQFQKGR